MRGRQKSDLKETIRDLREEIIELQAEIIRLNMIINSEKKEKPKKEKVVKVVEDPREVARQKWANWIKERNKEAKE